MKNFKLLALRILDGCAPHIRKCLKSGIFYYLCNDYTISEDGGSVEYRNHNLSCLNDDFFNIYEGKNIHFSISAIVGKNGDGKSSLVEVFVRLINNFAKKNIDSSICEVEGLRAELYFQYEDVIYRIRQKNDLSSLESSKIAILSKEGISNVATSKEMDVSMQIPPVFYSLLPNYSHYAYNENDYKSETSPASESRWLRGIMNSEISKNHIPLVIYPKRYNGNIDINIERELFDDRVLLMVLNSQLSEQRQSFNKGPFLLKLIDKGCSELQEKTISEFFFINDSTNLLNNEIKDLDDENFATNSRFAPYFILNGVESLVALSDIAKIVFPQDKDIDICMSFLSSSSSLSLKSDIENLRTPVRKYVYGGDYLDSIQSPVFQLYPEAEALLDKLGHINTCQLLRLLLVRKICEFWGDMSSNGLGEIKIDFESLFKDYSSLTEEDKCKHYLVYKTISILENNSRYKYVSPNIAFGSFRKSDNFPVGPLKKSLRVLKSDLERESHIALKLLQVYKYLVGEKIFLDEDIRIKLLELDGKDAAICVDIEKLKKKYKTKLNDVTLFPPAIYKIEMFVYKGDNLISFDLFSSGEKQWLRVLSSIVFYLLNIDKEDCTSVNIIFEEMELYFHPEWQRSFVNDLLKSISLLELRNIRYVNLVFVTHSPFILSDIPKTNVLFLKDGMPDYSMQENTFGANINSLLKNGFFLPTLPIGEFAHQKINSLFAKLHSGNFNEEELDTMYQDIIRVGEPFVRNQLLSLYNSFVSHQDLTSSISDFIDQKVRSEVERILAERELNK